MGKDYFSKEKGSKYSIYIIGFILEIAVTLISVMLFSAVIYFTEKGYEYASIFATVSVALGAFVASFYITKKIKNKAFFVGVAVGGVTFILVTLISLVMDNGALTANTIFHFIIIMLSSLIGSVIGVSGNQNKVTYM